MSFSSRSGSARDLSLPAALARDIEQAGYYPALVCDVVGNSLAGDEVVSHVVHQETTFDHDTVRRHVTVLVLTPTRSDATTRQRVISPGASAAAGIAALQIPSPATASTPVPSSTIPTPVSAANIRR